MNMSRKSLLFFLSVSFENTVAHNSGQVGRPEIVPYSGIFPYFASSLFTNGHFGHSGFVPYFASFPYFAVPYCERWMYIKTTVCVAYIFFTS